MDKQNSPCDLRAYLAEREQEGDNLKDLKLLSSHGKLEKQIDKMNLELQMQNKSKTFLRTIDYSYY